MVTRSFCTKKDWPLILLSPGGGWCWPKYLTLAYTQLSDTSPTSPTPVHFNVPNFRCLGGRLLQRVDRLCREVPEVSIMRDSYSQVANGTGQVWPFISLFNGTNYFWSALEPWLVIWPVAATGRGRFFKNYRKPPMFFLTATETIVSPLLFNLDYTFFL